MAFILLPNVQRSATREARWAVVLWLGIRVLGVEVTTTMWTKARWAKERLLVDRSSTTLAKFRRAKIQECHQTNHR